MVDSTGKVTGFFDDHIDLVNSSLCLFEKYSRIQNEILKKLRHFCKHDVRTQKGLAVINRTRNYKNQGACSSICFLSIGFVLVMTNSRGLSGSTNATRQSNRTCRTGRPSTESTQSLSASGSSQYSKLMSGVSKTKRANVQKFETELASASTARN